MKFKTYFNPKSVLMFLEKNHMTQNGLSEKLEIGPSYLSLMIGQRRPVSAKLRKRFVEFVEAVEDRSVAFEEFFLTQDYHICDVDRATGTDAN